LHSEIPCNLKAIMSRPKYWKEVENWAMLNTFITFERFYSHSVLAETRLQILLVGRNEK
jgi:hypothetical protein